MRTPQVLRGMDESYSDMNRVVLDMVASDENRFNSVKAKIEHETGEQLHGSAEDLRAFLERAEFKIKTSNTKLVQDMLQIANGIADTLYERNWRLLIAGGRSRDFITTDSPITIVPRSGSFPRIGNAGFGLANTIVNYPLTRRFALLGTFEPIPQHAVTLEASQIAAFNSAMIRGAHRFVWSRRPRIWHLRGKDIVNDLRGTWTRWHAGTEQAGHG
jgi:hypothetical protein